MIKKRIGILPGTFDPITLGHIDIIERSFEIVDELIIGVADNIKKKLMFTNIERQKMIKKDILLNFGKNNNIFIKKLNGLLVDFAKKNNANLIIRGLRAVSDFEYEFQMTGMNFHLNPKIETVFLMSSDRNSFISSNFIKEVYILGGDVSKFVSRNTLLNLKNKK